MIKLGLFSYILVVGLELMAWALAKLFGIFRGLK